MNKKNIFYAICGATLVGVTAFLVAKQNNKVATFLPLKERAAAIAKGPEWQQTKQRATTLYNTLTTNKAKTDLASIYMVEGRITGDRTYYDKAALQLVNAVLKADSNDFESNVYKAMILLSQHHFADAQVIGNKLLQRNQNSASIYGILVDANVELGNYKDAVAYTDKMVSLRPDLRSYSRVSYLREIYGDYTGAKAAMKMAVTAGVLGQEETEWCTVQLGHLYEMSGMIDTAEMAYNSALAARPGFAPAYAGLGRVEKAKKNYDKAIMYFNNAKGALAEYSYDEELASVYTLKGNKDKANEHVQLALDMLNAEAQKGNDDEEIGHYSDRELAYAYLMEDDKDKALEHALMEYNRRTNNIDVNEVLAWVYYKKGDFTNAAKYIQVALQTNSLNPILNNRAGLIFYNSGNKARGVALLTASLQHKNILEKSQLDETLAIIK
ncbi:MAG: tetratricopeptide repeat protein [Bacteroidia bacterium]